MAIINYHYLWENGQELQKGYGANIASMKWCKYRMVDQLEKSASMCRLCDFDHFTQPV